MFDLPPNLTRHFEDGSGRFNPLRLLQTPDDQLVNIARDLPFSERAALYRKLFSLRLGLLERLALNAAGVDVDSQRLRFLRILEAAD
jgi:hypothetical protein